MVFKVQSKSNHATKDSLRKAWAATEASTCEDLLKFMTNKYLHHHEGKIVNDNVFIMCIGQILQPVRFDVIP